MTKDPDACNFTDHAFTPTERKLQEDQGSLEA